MKAHSLTDLSRAGISKAFCGHQITLSEQVRNEIRKLCIHIRKGGEKARCHDRKLRKERGRDGCTGLIVTGKAVK